MPVDEDAATELELYADNEFAIYKQYKAVGKNLMRFVKKGTFSMERAVDAFEYPVEAAAKMYAKEFASPGEWSSLFTPATRRLVARRWAANFAQKVKDGEIAEFT